MNHRNIIKLSSLGIALLATSIATAAPNHEKAFKAMDKDQSGSICIKELTANLEAAAKKQGKEDAVKTAGKRAQNRLKSEDTDGNDPSVWKNSLLRLRKEQPTGKRRQLTANLLTSRSLFVPWMTSSTAFL